MAKCRVVERYSSAVYACWEFPTALPRNKKKRKLYQWTNREKHLFRIDKSTFCACQYFFIKTKICQLQTNKILIVIFFCKFKPKDLEKEKIWCYVISTKRHLLETTVVRSRVKVCHYYDV